MPSIRTKKRRRKGAPAPQNVRKQHQALVCQFEAHSALALRVKSRCIEWSGPYNSSGRPTLMGNTPAHRFAFYLKHGHWPQRVDMTCVNRRCVNVEHMREVAHGEYLPAVPKPGYSAADACPELERIYDAERNVYPLHRFGPGAKYAIACKCDIPECGELWTANLPNLVKALRSGNNGCPRCKFRKQSRRTKGVPHTRGYLHEERPDLIPLINMVEFKRLDPFHAGGDVRRIPGGASKRLDKIPFICIRCNETYLCTPWHKTRGDYAAWCPHCGLKGRSWSEILFQHELKSFSVFCNGLKTNAWINVPDSTNGGWEVDALHQRSKCIFEFDGAKDHQREGSKERDRRKTSELQDLRDYVVIRIRERPLSKMRICASATVEQGNIHGAVVAALRLFEEITGRDIRELNEYEASGQYRAEAAALEYTKSLPFDRVVNLSVSTTQKLVSFPTTLAAARSVGIKGRNTGARISLAIGRKMKAGKCYWARESEIEAVGGLQLFLSNFTPLKPKHRPVRRLKNGQTTDYPDISTAASKNGISLPAIWSAIKRRTDGSAGLCAGALWEYVDSPLPPPEEQDVAAYRRIRNKRPGRPRPVRAFRFEGGRAVSLAHFEDKCSAASAFGIKRGSFNALVNEMRPHSHVFFAHEDDIKAAGGLQKYAKRIRSRISKRKKNGSIRNSQH